MARESSGVARCGEVFSFQGGEVFSFQGGEVFSFQGGEVFSFQGGEVFEVPLYSPGRGGEVFSFEVMASVRSGTEELPGPKSAPKIAPGNPPPLPPPPGVRFGKFLAFRMVLRAG